MLRKKGEITTGRFVIPYRCYGNGKPSIICVNGVQQTMAAWHSVIQRFSKEYEIIVFDLPGQGRARIISGPVAVPLDELTSVLHQVLLTTCGQTAVHVVGASSGAIIVAAYASQYPRFVNRVILGSFGVRPTRLMLDTFKEGLALYQKGKGHEIAHLIIERFGQKINEANRKKMIEQFRHMDQETFMAFYAQCERITGSRHIDEYVDLKNIKAETLIINGEDDAILDNQDLRIAAAQIPNCEVKIVKGVGHFLHWESDDMLDLYDQYLKESKNRKEPAESRTQGEKEHNV